MELSYFVDGFLEIKPPCCVAISADAMSDFFTADIFPERIAQC